MRIAIINWSNRRVGGVETYLNTIIPELTRDGHQVAFCCEVDKPAERLRIDLPEDSPTWCVASLGAAKTLAALKAWTPDVIYSHKLDDPELERQVLGVAPSVFFAHDYNGTCISGSKTFKFPVVQPCNRTFGWQCLMHYFPHRCGGLSPVTMVRLYSLQSKRLENLHAYDAIVTHSDHMLEELMKHGLSPKRAYNFPYYVQSTTGNGNRNARVARTFSEALNSDEALAQDNLGLNSKTEFTLLFSGRMEYLKGAHVLLDALPEVTGTLAKPLRVIFAGEGRERRALERQAARMRNAKLNIEFIGWVERKVIEELLKACDLMVVPSLWPEPFGLVGPEAGQFGVPVAAFDVGGIGDWLSDGLNGFLAPGCPPTSHGLAQAIIKCLQDPAQHAILRRGAFEASRQFNIKNHLTALLEVFSNVTGTTIPTDLPVSAEPAT